MKLKILCILSIVSFMDSNCIFAQEKDLDSLFIKVDKDLLGNKILINKFDFNGNSIIKKNDNTSLTILFTTDSLKRKILKEEFLENKDPNHLTYKGSYVRSYIYGLEFQFYNLDISAIEKNIKLYNKTEQRLKGFDSLMVDRKKFNLIKKGFHQFTYLPLKIFFKNKSFLNDKWVVDYSGSEKDYEVLKRNVLKANNIFLILENGTLGFDYQIMEVKWIKPIPGL